MNDMQTEINPAQVPETQQQLPADGPKGGGANQWTQPPSPIQPSEIDNLPAIKGWQPAPGFSALGALAGLFVWVLLAVLVGPLLAWIIQAIVVAVYALVFYRSYFTENPRVTSSKTISFLNYAVTFSSNVIGVAFGWCWNQNLRRSHDAKVPKKGISYVVAIAYFFVMIGFLAWYESTPHLVHNADGSYTMVQPGTNAAQNNTSSPASSQSSSKDSAPSQATIPGTNTQITVPSEWSHQTYNQNNESSNAAFVLFPSYAKEDTGILVLAWDASQYLTDEYISQYGDSLSIRTVSEEAVLDRNRVNIDSVESESAELIEIGGIDYWKAQATGSYSGLPIKNTSYFCFANKKLYEFTLSSLDESDETNEALSADMEKIVASATYQ